MTPSISRHRRLYSPPAPGLPWLFRRRFLVASGGRRSSPQWQQPQIFQRFARPSPCSRNDIGYRFETTPISFFARFHGAAGDDVVWSFWNRPLRSISGCTARLRSVPNLTQLAGRSVVFDAAYRVSEAWRGYTTLCRDGSRINEHWTLQLGDPYSPLPKSFRAAGYQRPHRQPVQAASA